MEGPAKAPTLKSELFGRKVQTIPSETAVVRVGIYLEKSVWRELINLPVQNITDIWKVVYLQLDSEGFS